MGVLQDRAGIRIEALKVWADGSQPPFRTASGSSAHLGIILRAVASPHSCECCILVNTSGAPDETLCHRNGWSETAPLAQERTDWWMRSADTPKNEDGRIPGTNLPGVMLLYS